jgi:outer membrane biogenesis lipoprotein LolB
MYNMHMMKVLMVLVLMGVLMLLQGCATTGSEGYGNCNMSSAHIGSGMPF